MNIEEKKQLLKGLETRPLVLQLNELTESLEQRLLEDMHFKAENTGYLANIGSDCPEVKKRLAELTVGAPETDTDGKKYTAAAKEAWVTMQRDKDSQLVKAIGKQHDVAFVLEQNRISIDMTKKKLEAIRTILEIKTAQINFLAANI